MSTSEVDATALAIQRARALCDLRRFGDAVQTLTAILGREPQNPYAWCLMARAQLGAGHSDAALQAARNASSLGPEEEWPHRLASLALYQLGDYPQAADAAKEAVRLAPHHWAAHVRLAYALARIKGRSKEANAAAKRGLELAPHEPDAHMAAGAVAVAARRREEAAAAFRRALEIDPQNAAAHNELARLNLRRRPLLTMGSGLLADAARGFATAVRTDPRADVSRRNLDVVLRLFLGRTAYFIFLDAALAARAGANTTAAPGRILPILLLAIPAAFAVRFVIQLPPSVRPYLARWLGDRWIAVAAALEALATATVIVSCLVTQTARPPLVAAGALMALSTRIILWLQARRAG